MCGYGFTHRYLKFVRLANTLSGRTVIVFEDKSLYEKEDSSFIRIPLELYHSC